jgi:prevent-host-death family protein
MQGPNLKGAIAEAEVAAAAVKLGIPVYKPVAEHGRSDLILEVGQRLLRVQCKWGRLDPDRGVIEVGLQTNRLTPRGYVQTSYTEDEIDVVAVYCGGLDRCYLLPTHLVVNRRGIWLRLSPTENGQRACINLASEFEFAGAVAQLEERHAGSVEAGGSSPPSSTDQTADSEPRLVGAHEFRNHFGYFMEEVAAGLELVVTRRGRPFVRLSAAAEQLPLAA